LGDKIERRRRTMGDLKDRLVLVVDDDPEVIDYISAILEDHQMKTMSANNAKEAIKRVQETRPDIILLDLMMSKQSGLGFFNELKKNEEYKDIPVIVVSGASKVTGVDMKSFIYNKEISERKQKVMGIDAKPEAYVEKPVDPEKLIAEIQKFLR
jgi:two-component system KDP operon response regulator KdpE